MSKSIDFLPKDYHQKRRNRHSFAWRSVAIGTFGAALVLAMIVQLNSYWRLQAHFVEAEIGYTEAQKQQQQLTTLQNNLAMVRYKAELYCYLEHTWPKTQLLKLLSLKTPDTIFLESIEVYKGDRQNSSPAQAIDEKFSPEKKDLLFFRKRYDSDHTLATLFGITVDNVELYRYLEDLKAHPLVADAELDSFTDAHLELSSGKANQKAMRFQITITLIHGYGQKESPQELPPLIKIDDEKIFVE
ncbi:MAG: PilN domain-containing protein [Pirellulaceae bacterium]|nr:PilN domain-containing protein [Pirellulaceae bacterium]